MANYAGIPEHPDNHPFVPDMMNEPYTFSQKVALAIAPKITGFVSILGSLLIISDIFRDKKKHRQTYYNLILCTSCFDLTTSIVFFLSTWPIPKVTKIYGASGTIGTCTFQGFFVQLSIAVQLYLLCLTIHYLLVIVHKWSDVRLKRAERIMHTCVVLFTFGTSFAGLPLKIYNSANLWCWIASVPADCTTTAARCIRGGNAAIYRWAFYFGPLWLIIFAVTFCMARVCYVTWMGERASRNHRMTSTNALSNGESDKIRRLTQQVTTQALCYVVAFYLTHIFPTVVRIIQLEDMEPPFWTMLMTAVFLPLQGFFNSVNYVRPRYARYRMRNPDASTGMALKETIVWKNPRFLSKWIGGRKGSADKKSSNGTTNGSGNPGSDPANEEHYSSNSSPEHTANSHSGVIDDDEVDDAEVMDPAYALTKRRCRDHHGNEDQRHWNLHPEQATNSHASVIEEREEKEKDEERDENLEGLQSDSRFHFF